MYLIRKNYKLKNPTQWNEKGDRIPDATIGIEYLPHVIKEVIDPGRERTLQYHTSNREGILTRITKWNHPFLEKLVELHSLKRGRSRMWGESVIETGVVIMEGGIVLSVRELGIDLFIELLEETRWRNSSRSWFWFRPYLIWHLPWSF